MGMPVFFGFSRKTDSRKNPLSLRDNRDTVLALSRQNLTNFLAAA